MLAGHGVPAGSIELWAVEPKLDGWRASVTVDNGELTARSRRGKHLTSSLPGLQPLAAIGRSLVLDGELVAGQGRLEDFYRVAPRLASRSGRAGPVEFVVFDILWLDGETLTDRSYEERRKVLLSLPLTESGVTAMPAWPGEDSADVLAACDQLGVEGVVLKRLASPYRPGVRSYDWRKVKCPAWGAHLERRRQR